MPSRNVILVPEPASHAFGRRAFAGMVSAASELGDVRLALRVHSAQPWPEAIRESGAVAAIVNVAWRRDIAPLIATGIPLVSIVNRPSLQQRITVVTNDEAAIGRLAAEHFLAMGHRHFATFTAADMRGFFEPRISAFVRTIEAAGFEVMHGPDPVDPSLDTEEPPPEAATPWDANSREWLAAQPKPLALFAPYDYFAYIAVNLCDAAGFSVPNDVAIVGVDDDELYCPLTKPPLSSVATAAYAIGRRALMTLHRALTGDRSPTITVVPPAGLIVRGSSDIEAINDTDVLEAMRYVRENVARPLSVDDVVRHVMVSRRTLERRFKESLNRTIREQIRHTRVECAKRLLIDTDLSLREVAKRSGLGAQQRLQTLFKAQTSQTPALFRKRFQQPS